MYLYAVVWNVGSGVLIYFKQPRYTIAYKNNNNNNIII